MGQLARSLEGFEQVFLEIAKLSKIKGEMSVYAAGSERGSVLIPTIIQIITSGLPFADVNPFLNFLKVADPTRYKGALEFLGTGHRTLNDYFAKNPLDQATLETLLGLFVGYLIGHSRGIKRNIGSPEIVSRVPVAYVRPLRKLIHEGRYKKAFSPLIDDTVDSIEIGSQPKSVLAVVNDETLEEYLEDKEIILPQFQDGKEVRLKAELVSLQSSNGEHLGIKIHDSTRIVLMAYPIVDTTTDEYIDYYKKHILINAAVIRGSMYKKPKLKLLSIKLEQEQLPSHELGQ